MQEFSNSLEPRQTQPCLKDYLTSTNKISAKKKIFSLTQA
uniref:Uncharacterized protein n=1 Tax=Arundo donax TaxID=35708 RepID=A0A0A9H9Z6_ARUDO